MLLCQPFSLIFWFLTILVLLKILHLHLQSTVISCLLINSFAFLIFWKVSTFLLMYRAHCQRILDAIVRANFEELNTLVFHFWQKIPHHLAPALSSSLLINLLGICDIRLYRTIIKLISVTLGQPLTDL